MEHNMTKWFWKMRYCEEHKVPPAQKWAWDRAEEAYNEKLKENGRQLQYN